MKLLGLLALTALSLTANTGKKIEKTCIVLSVNNGDDKIIFPVVPANIPELSLPQNNDTFKGILGDMSVIGVMGLRQIKLEGLLPDDVDKYPWTYPNSNNATEIINFVNKYRVDYIPFRLTITRGDNTYLNMAVVINNFSYYQDNVGDYHYSMDMVEYRFRDNKTGGLVS